MPHLVQPSSVRSFAVESLHGAVPLKRDLVLGLLSKATLVVLDGQTKESCLAAYLLSKKVLALKKSLLFFELST